MAVNVVLGAGGPTGLECVKRLLAVTEGPVRAVVRDPAKYEAAFREAADEAAGGAGGSARLQVVSGDVTQPDSLAPALKDAGGVIFAASGRGYWSARAVDYQGVVNVIDAVKSSSSGSSGSSSGAHIVLVSSMLTDPANRFHPVRMLLNSLRWGLMDEKWKSEVALRASGVTYTVVRPGGLTAAPAGRSQLQAEVDARLESLMGSISRGDVAGVCVEALRNDAGRNVTLSVVDKKGAPLPQPGPGSLAAELARLFGSIAGGAGGAGATAAAT